MRSRKLSFICCLAMGIAPLAAFTGMARAADFAEPKVEYSADQYVGSEDKVVKFKVYHAQGKERMDLEETGGKQYVITRFDRKLSWTVMPDEKMYIEMSLEEGKKGPGGQARDIKECSVIRKAAGRETVNGVGTARSDIDMSCPDGTRFRGSIWESKEGILVKMEAVAKEGSGNKGSMKMELKNLKIGKLDPKVFEVPSGYQKMQIPVGMMPGMGGMDTKEMKKPPHLQKKSPPPEPPRGTGRSYTAQPRDTGRSYTAEPRAGGEKKKKKLTKDEMLKLKGSSGAAQPGAVEQGETGQTDSGQPAGAPQAEPEQQKEKGTVDKALEPVKKLKGLFGW